MDKSHRTNLTYGEILANFEISKILNIFDRVRFWLILELLAQWA
jgi:hypothetical protein